MPIFANQNCMVLSSNQNIADYYNQTLNHYQNWWRLNNNLAVHYGIWDKSTRNFQESLKNTNNVLAGIANIQDGEYILDAGCGVGGSAFYLAKKHNANVTGITLSDKQYYYAIDKCKELNLEDKVKFSIQDYTKTNFADESFNLIWAIESITSSQDKNSFAKEAYRLLAPGGRLIIADYFKSDISNSDPDNLLEKWRKLWSMAPFLCQDKYNEIFNKNGFSLESLTDVTSNIAPTSKRMYWSYLLGGPLAVAYNLFNKPTPFAKNHYKSGLYQYKALKKKLWDYNIILFRK